MEAVHGPQHVLWIGPRPSAIGGRIGPEFGTAGLRIVQRAFEARDAAAGADRRRAPLVDEVKRRLRRRRRYGHPWRERSVAEHGRECEPGIRQAAGRATDDRVAASDELRRACLLQHDGRHTEERRHHRHAQAESAGEHGAADRPRPQRSDGQHEDHHDDPSTICPSRIVSSRCAHAATATSWVTTTTAVPSSCSRSSRVMMCPPVR